MEGSTGIAITSELISCRLKLFSIHMSHVLHNAGWHDPIFVSVTSFLTKRTLQSLSLTQTLSSFSARALHSINSEFLFVVKAKI